MSRNTTFFQALTLFALLAAIAASFFLPNGTSLVWTLFIPLVPLFIVVVGYNQWRKLCPLAWIAALGQFLYWIPKRKVPEWFEKHFYSFQFGLLFAAFTARLLLLNFNGMALAIFFLSVALLAFLVNLVYAGKSWCNFFCPVSVVEKIYCGSNALLSQQTSACGSCVACKSNCPDIDLEKGYWKENGDRSKRAVFYAFSGLVFGFYAYYYAISGSWDYYFNGTWTNAGFAYSSLLDPGFFFLPVVPKIVAVPFTLLFFSVLSYFVFAQIEHLLPRFKWTKNKDEKSIEHITKAIAAFCAFNIFYIFAGAPTFSHYPFIYALFHFVVIVVSSIILWKEIFREERFYLQERFAQKILNKWKGPWPAPTNLKEIYYTYATQQESQHEKLELYKETVLELLSDGTLTKEDLTLLDKIREQLGLSEAEHKKILRSLKRDNSDLFDQENALSAEKVYQLRIYKEHLKEILEQESNVDEIQKAQQRFHIDDEEHQKIYDELVHEDHSLDERIDTKLKQLKESARLIGALSFHQEQKSTSYLLFILSQSFSKKFAKLCDTMSLLSPQDKEILRHLKQQMVRYFKRAPNEQVELPLPLLYSLEHQNKLHAIIESLQDISIYDAERLNLMIRDHLTYNDDDLTAAVLYYFYEHELFNIIDYRTYTHSECQLISEVTRAIREQSSVITNIEIMAYLHMVPIFSTLDFEELHQLSAETRRVSFGKNSTLVTQGEEGDTFYIITKGVAEVTMEKNGTVTTLATLKTGDYIGEVSIISNTKRTATVTAKEAVETLQLSSKAFESLLNRNPHLSLRIMKDITARLLEQNSV